MKKIITVADLIYMLQSIADQGHYNDEVNFIGIENESVVEPRIVVDEKGKSKVCIPLPLN